MRLTLFLLSFLAAPLSAQQIGQMDRLLAFANPVFFCVELHPEDTSQEDLATWSFPHGAPLTYDLRDGQIMAMPGMAFGFQLRPAGFESLKDITVVVDHPPLEDSGKTRHSWNAELKPGQNALSFYGFGRPGEVTPGRWEFSYIKDDRVLYRHVLDLVPGPDRDQSCVEAEAEGVFDE